MLIIIVIITKNILKVDCILNKKIRKSVKKKKEKLNSVLNVLLANIFHLKVGKHINSPIEWFLQQLRRQYQHS